MLYYNTGGWRCPQGGFLLQLVVHIAMSANDNVEISTFNAKYLF
jgi:hypothetical protein